MIAVGGSASIHCAVIVHDCEEPTVSATRDGVLEEFPVLFPGILLSFLQILSIISFRCDYNIPLKANSPKLSRRLKPD